MKNLLRWIEPLHFKKWNRNRSQDSKFYTLILLTAILHILYVSVCVANQGPIQDSLDGRTLEANECQKNVDCQVKKVGHVCLEYPSKNQPGLVYYKCFNCKVGQVAGRDECSRYNKTKNRDLYIAVISVIAGFVVLVIVILAVCCLLSSCPGYHWRKNWQREKLLKRHASQSNTAAPGLREVGEGLADRTGSATDDVPNTNNDLLSQQASTSTASIK